MEWDTDIPVPERDQKYPFATMPVGASFFTAGKTSTQMTNAATNYKARGLRFTTRAVTENGIKGSRVWRIE